MGEGRVGEEAGVRRGFLGTVVVQVTASGLLCAAALVRLQGDEVLGVTGRRTKASVHGSPRPACRLAGTKVSSKRARQLVGHEVGGACTQRRVGFRGYTRANAALVGVS